MKPSASLREGDDYIVTWSVLGLALHFTRVRETDSSIRALLTPMTWPDRKRILAPMMVNLFTKADRDRMAASVIERVESDPDVDRAETKKRWLDTIEEGFAAAIDLHTTPVQALDLSIHDNVPDEPDLIWPILARNQVNVWLADQASGKSYDALLVAAIIASGRHDTLPAPLRCDVTGPVVYCDSETDDTVQWRRLCRIAAGLGLSELPRVHYLHINPPFTSQAAHVRAEIARLGAVLSVVDSLTFSAGGNLNDSELSVPTMNAIGELGQNCTKLAIAHHSKAGRTEGAMPSIMGSGAFEFKARSIWIIRVDSEPGADHITQAWSNKKGSESGVRSGFGMRLDFNESNTAVRFSSVQGGESDFVTKHTGTVKDRVLSAIVGTALMKASTKDIARDTGITETNVARAARDLVKDGTIRLLEGGQGKGNIATYAAVNADRPEPGIKTINGSVGSGPEEAISSEIKTITQNNHLKVNDVDCFDLEGSNNQTITPKQSKTINDCLEGRNWAGRQ